MIIINDALIFWSFTVFIGSINNTFHAVFITFLCFCFKGFLEWVCTFMCSYKVIASCIQQRLVMWKSVCCKPALSNSCHMSPQSLLSFDLIAVGVQFNLWANLSNWSNPCLATKLFSFFFSSSDQFFSHVLALSIAVVFGVFLFKVFLQKKKAGFFLPYHHTHTHEHSCWLAAITQSVFPKMIRRVLYCFFWNMAQCCCTYLDSSSST